MMLIDSILQDIKGSRQCMSFLQTKDDDIDRFLNQYRDIIEKVATLRYPEDEFLSFEREMQYFYVRLKKTNTSQFNEITSAIHFLFCGICTFYIKNYEDSKAYFTAANTLSTRLQLNYTSTIIHHFLKQIDIVLQKEKILILVSPNGLMDKYIRASQNYILKHKWNIKNFQIKTKSTKNYLSLSEVLIDASNYEYVFFIGHGDEYFMVVTANGVEELKPEIIQATFDRQEVKPRVFGAFSCAYDNYMGLAGSGYFDYFFISSNSGDEHSEIFIKAFIDALDDNQNVIDASSLGRMALMCRMSGANQMEVYQNDEKIYPDSNPN